MDEVQTGIGLTGKFWAHEHFDARPDIICFGKKTQVCGMLASTRVDEVEGNVFKEASRINSTFGGNLIDMVRFSHILRIIDDENLVENARLRGEELRLGLEALSLEYPNIIGNARGRGLMCAFDLRDTEQRDQFRKDLLQRETARGGLRNEQHSIPAASDNLSRRGADGSPDSQKGAAEMGMKPTVNVSGLNHQSPDPL